MVCTKIIESRVVVASIPHIAHLWSKPTEWQKRFHPPEAVAIVAATRLTNVTTTTTTTRLLLLLLPLLQSFV
jgi:hypothetical protein